METKKQEFRAGFVAIVGQPNAGKSTLLNALLAEKVSIVSEKPQTTRGRVTGILNLPQSQIIFVDSPGTIKSTTGINKFLQEEVIDVIAKADVVCVALSADATEAHAKSLIEVVQKSRKPWFAVITKIDLLGSGTRTPQYFSYLIEQKISFVSISTEKREEEAVNEILTRVVPLLPEAEGPLFDEDLYTTQTMRQMSAEFIREAAFDKLRQEIPYGLAVKIIDFKEDEEIPRIFAEVILDRTSHKAIVIGAKGQTLKEIGSQARKAIEKMVGTQVYLEIHVQVKENWTQNPRMMKELGYVVGK